jgi:hypothetical protein
MRWDNLFDDLESQLEHELESEEVDVRAEEERLRLGRLSTRDRLSALHDSSEASGCDVRLHLIDGRSVVLTTESFGKDWVTGTLRAEDGTTRTCIVPLSAIASIELPRDLVTESLRSSERPGRLSARLGLAFVLRDLARRRCAVELHLIGGVLHGTIDRVGRDHLDLAVHDRGTPRRESAVGEYRLVPFSQLVLVRV